jgi:hypothetical protein
LLVAHLSDLHLSTDGDVAWLERQLARIAARRPHHLAITGDLLDRWNPRLFDRALDALAAHGFMHADRVTILHGNHDLASSGGHPRRNADLVRLALRFWDPPPLVRWRQRRFLEAIETHATGVASASAFVKTLPSGMRIAVLDTVPVPWRPLLFDGRAIIVRHAIGRVSHADTTWLSTLKGASPLVVLVHHYPLDGPMFTWTPDRHDLPPNVDRWIRRAVREVRVPTAIVSPDRERFWAAAQAADVRLVLCGHLHRARLEWHKDIAVGLNGQSGAEWAGRTIGFYRLDGSSVRQELESTG